jgi:hypothetical protein
MVPIVAVKEAAREHARRFPIIPLLPGKKLPATRHGVKDAQSTPEWVEQWWGERVTVPYNIGIACGDGLVVLDADGPEGVAWVAQQDLPETYTVETRRGRHFYYHGVARSGKPHEQVDVKASGGYVVAAGSFVSGFQYKANDRPIAKLTDADVAKLTTRKGTDLRDIDRIAPSARNNTLTTAAGKLRNLGLEPGEIESALLAMNAQRCDPPLPEDEVRRIAKNSGGWERGSLGGEIRKGNLKPERPRTVFRAVPASDVTATPARFLWDGRVPLGMVTLLVGQGGDGKSMLTTMLAAQLSRGVIRGDLSGAHPTVIASAEDYRGQLKVRLLAHNADTRLVHFIETVAPEGYATDMELTDNPEYGRSLQEFLSSGGYKLLVIDTVVAHISEQHDTWKEQHVRRVLQPLVGIAEKLDMAVIGIMHTNRRDSKDILTRISGSGGFGNLARSVLYLGRRKDDPPESNTRVIYHAKCNVGPLRKALLAEIQSLYIAVDEGDARAARLRIVGSEDLDINDALETPRGRKSTIRDSVKGFLASQLANGPVPVTVVERELAAAGFSVGNGTSAYRAARRELGVQPCTIYDGTGVVSAIRLP